MKVAFYSGVRPGINGLYNRTVQLIDKGKFSHCELVFSDGLSASASFIDKGVRFKTIDYFSKSSKDWVIVDLPEFDEQKAKQWFLDHEGHKYDLLGNLRFIFGWVREDDNKWFCSEALMAALGFKEPWRFGPNGAAAILMSV